MNPTPTVPAPLAPDWAFVVQLRAGSSFEPAELCGRVEHVASGKAGNFDSLEGLRLLMQCVLRSAPYQKPDQPTTRGDLDGLL